MKIEQGDHIRSRIIMSDEGTYMVVCRNNEECRRYRMSPEDGWAVWEPVRGSDGEEGAG